jgi:hypothetical protein
MTFIFGDSRFEARLRYPIYCTKVLIDLKINVSPLKQNTGASSADFSSALCMIILWEV